MLNEYLTKYHKAMTSSTRFAAFSHRHSLVEKYAWAIPNEAAITVFKQYAPIIEIGAGKGYWASLIRKADVDILAFDKYLENNYFTDKETPWTEILKGDEQTIKDHPNRTLFLCWPPYDNPMAYNCLMNYKGDTLIYVGEDEGGCTGDDNFWKEIGANWKDIEGVKIPQWEGIHDYLLVYKRKNVTV
jgi:hypothetical protein